MICFFDTETTGVPNKNAKALSLQPHVLQLAVSLYDEARRPVFEFSTLVKLPENTQVPQQAFDVHGISAALTQQYGVLPSQAIGLLRFACARASRVVAHNAQFDEKLMGYETSRLDLAPVFENEKLFCTMEATTPLCKLPPTPAMIKWGHGDKFKNASLAEAYHFLFAESFSGAHDALVDTRACARVYYELVDRKLISG